MPIISSVAIDANAPVWDGTVATAFAGGHGHPGLAVQDSYTQDVAEYIEKMLSGEELPIEPVNSWDGSNTVPAKGTGTQADLYQISNGAELNWVARLSEEDSKGKYFIITKDIYLNDPANIDITYDEDGYVKQYGLRCWPSGGVSSYALDAFGVFAGNIDGQGYTIFGMNNGWAPNGAWGLFGTLGGTATIKNINIDSAFYKRSNASGTWGWSNTFAAGIAGDTLGGMITIGNCTVYRSNITEQATGWGNYSGILARNRGYGGVVIKDCGVDSKIAMAKSGFYCGGIIGSGWTNPVQVSNCWSNVYPAGADQTNGSDGATFTNCYTLNTAKCATVTTEVPTGITVVTGSVKGDAAKTTTPNIGWGHKWTTVADANRMPLAVETVCDGEWVVDAKATSAAAGSMSKTCSICGKTETKEIAQIPDLSNYNGEYTLDVNTAGEVIVGGEATVIVPTGSEVVIVVADGHLMTSEGIEGGIKYVVTVDD